MKNISIPIRYGLVTSAVLIAYFLVLALFNNHVRPAFSFFNAIITSCGIFEAVRVSKLENVEKFSFGEGFKIGIITGFLAALLFSVFFLVYATEINPDFLLELLNTIPGDLGADVGMVTFVVFIMGLTTTVISTFVVMQFFKNE